MNNQQRKYALERARELTQDALSTIKKEHLKNNLVPGVILTCKQKRDLVRKGKVKMKPENKIHSGYNDTNISYIYDFSSFEYDKTYKNEKKFNRDMAKVSAAGELAADTIMLGDSKEALDAIEALSITLATI